MHRRIATVAAVVLASLLLAGCGSDDNGGTIADNPTTPTDAGGPAAKKVELKAANFAFDPTAIQLTAGEDVQFVITNGDDVEHSLTVETLGIDQDVEGGKTAEAPVTKSLKAGTYPFVCKYHPAKMTGTITVT